MTSVQNHRLLLNGNSNLLWIAVIILLLFTQACSILFPERDVSERKEPPVPVLDTILTEEVIDSLDILFPLIVKDTYNIAYLYPLQLDKMDFELSVRAKSMRSAALEYHKGVKMALDTLTNCGFNFNVYFYDLQFNETDLSNVFEFLKKNKIDLVFGPFLSNQILSFDSFSKQYRKNTISSITNFNKCEINNPYYFFSRPGTKQIARIASDIVNSTFEPVTVMVVRHDREQEELLANQFIDKIDTNLISASQIHEIVIRSDKWERLVIPTGKLGNNNILFIPGNNEEFVSTILSQIRNYDREFTIIGMERWPYFGNIDGRLWDRFNIHIITPYRIDYYNKTTNNFIKDFRKLYHTEPGEFAFTGFDETIYYLGRLINYGVYFQRYFIETDTYYGPKPVKLLQTQYEFEFIDGCNGWSNTYLHLLKYENHRLVKLR